MSLAELAAEQNARRLARKQAAEHATEEYLLAKIEESEGGVRAPSMQQLADKWGCSRQMIEHKLFKLRNELDEHPIDDPGAATFLGALLNDMAKAVAAAKEGSVTDGSDDRS